MKYSTLLFAVTATALVAPEQVTILDEQQPAVSDVIQAWWDSTLSRSTKLFTSLEKRITDSIRSFDASSYGFDSDDHPHPPRRGHGGHHRGDKTKTIYELIKSNQYTTQFASLLDNDDFSEIKKLLDSTEHNKTLFVPTDKAFERIPHHGDKPPPKEFVLALLKYHISPGLHTAHDLITSHTLPSNLSLDTLGSHPQRLRISTGLLFTIRVNIISKIVYSNIEAKNGIIHAIDHVLVPPPSQEKIISLLPTTFSTFSLGLEKTELSVPDHKGGTLFAPTNSAWRRLGPRANAFLFSPRGLKYLKALLKYHFVVDQTLYSDAFYGEKKDEQGVEGGKYWHVDLATLLDDKAIAVDVKRWRGWVTIVLNGFTKVIFQDGIASDGVVQVIGKILIPPHEHHGGHGAEDDDKDIDVEDLKARLERYVEKGNEAGDL
ncbi:FAS1 domain-containing protein [Triangularia verruculosa]|uniref:FAS1 domain-containing protein n=1 Tax=Triangularia verruculosa TaxID=2587418 RepID=A0AAN6XBI3_9PEZI|nr:FAS1 domain-containing protein [Triangularia verruculosa]